MLGWIPLLILWPDPLCLGPPLHLRGLYNQYTAHPRLIFKLTLKLFFCSFVLDDDVIVSPPQLSLSPQPPSGMDTTRYTTLIYSNNAVFIVYIYIFYPTQFIGGFIESTTPCSHSTRDLYTTHTAKVYYIAEYNFSSLLYAHARVHVHAVSLDGYSGSMNFTYKHYQLAQSLPQPEYSFLTGSWRRGVPSFAPPSTSCL